LRDQKIDGYLLSTAENYLQVAGKASQELTYDHDLLLGLSSRREPTGELEKLKAAERDKLSTIQDVQFKIEGITHEIVEVSKKNFTEAQLDAQRARWIFISVFIGGVIFAFTLSIFMAKMILRPIEKLSEAVSEIGSGNLSYALINKSSDEIGSLVRNFNNMRVQLKKYLDEITESKQNLEGAKKELEERLAELEKFKRLTVDREMKMIALKEQIGELQNKIDSHEVKKL
jgi:methyl-accepting chemotaxis protein